MITEFDRCMARGRSYQQMSASSQEDGQTPQDRRQRQDPRMAELERFLGERGEMLLCEAVLLAGTREAAEDLFQAALERLLRNWRKIDGDPEGYLRRTLHNLAADGWRRQGLWRRKRRLLEAPEAVDPVAVLDIRDQLVRLLLRLPPRQRSVLVLRYFEELTEDETAEVLGCSVGTVKSAASRGLTRLRELSQSRSDPAIQRVEERSS
jgi:RNA polymerase sigma-70 factor (sigma-E family)